MYGTGGGTPLTGKLKMLIDEMLCYISIALCINNPPPMCITKTVAYSHLCRTAQCMQLKKLIFLPARWKQVAAKTKAIHIIAERLQPQCSTYMEMEH